MSRRLIIGFAAVALSAPAAAYAQGGGLPATAQPVAVPRTSGDQAMPTIQVRGGIVARPVEAARLFGAADMLREQTGSPLLPSEASRYDVMVNTARDQTDQIVWSEAWTAGHTAALDDVVAPILEHMGWLAECEP